MKYVKSFEVDASFEEVFRVISIVKEKGFETVFSRKYQCDGKQEWGVIAIRRTIYWADRSVVLTIVLERAKHGVLMDVISMLDWAFGFVHRSNIKWVLNYLQEQGFKLYEIAGDK